jgi:hypothetical protein
MKKIFIFIAIASLLTGKILGQPILTASNTNFNIGDAFHYHAALYTSSPGSAGANQTWNFSTLGTGLAMTDSIVQPYTTTYGSSYPSANKSFTYSSYFYYYFTNNDSIIYHGGEGGSWSITFSDPQKILSYPFSYDSTFVDTYSGLSNSAGTLTTNVGTITVTGDGYGTLQLPYGNITNVLRVKTVKDQANTTSGNTTYVTLTSYQWYLPGIHRPVLSLTYNSGTYSTMYISQSDFVGIENIREYINDISFYPNPAIDNLTIETPAQAIIEILNTEGQILKSFNTNDKTTTIDISGLTSGMYFVKAKMENGFVVKKFMKE